MYGDFAEPNGDAARRAVANLLKVAVSDVEILNSSFAGDAGKKFDGLCSVVKVFFVEYKVGETIGQAKFLAKMLPLKSKLANWWNKMHLADREVEFYTKIWPKMSLKAPNFEVLPRFYDASNDNLTLLMEDLKADGFKMIHDEKPELKNTLNYNQTLAIIDILAKFHALGFHFLNTFEGGIDAFERENPWVANGGKLGQFLTNTDQDIIKENTELYVGLCREMLPLVKTYLSEDISSRFEASIPTLAEASGKSRNPLDHSFCVIAHGDLWSNNILFQFHGDDDTKVAGVKFIDFQECMRSRPTTDLACLFTNSLTAEMREDRQEHFLRTYHKSLASELKVWGYEIDDLYSFEKLISDYKSGFGQGFYWGIMNGWSAYKSADAGLGALFESENEGKLKVWEKKEYKFEGIKRENLPDGARRVISLIKEAADNGLI